MIWQFCMEMMRCQSLCFQLKHGTPVFWKRFSFSENRFQILSIKIVQNFHWLSHKNMPISQTEGYFQNPLYHFFRSIYALSVGFKMKPLRKSVFKNQPIFCRKTCWKKQWFIFTAWCITFFKHLYSLILDKRMYRT